MLGLYRSRPADRGEVQAAGHGGRIVPGRAARRRRIKSDVAAARRLFAEWPTPIVAVGSEVGDALPYPGASIEKDFAWSPVHPVVDAYRAVQADALRRAGVRAGRGALCRAPDDGYFKLSDPGTISVLDDGRTRFTPAADGKHRYLIVDPAQKERVTSLYTDDGVRRAGSTAGPRAGSAGMKRHARGGRRRVRRLDSGGGHQVVGSSRPAQAAPRAGRSRRLRRRQRQSAPAPARAAACRAPPRRPPQPAPPSPRRPSRCSTTPAASATTPRTRPAASTSRLSSRSIRSPPIGTGGS